MRKDSNGERRERGDERDGRKREHIEERGG